MSKKIKKKLEIHNFCLAENGADEIRGGGGGGRGEFLNCFECCCFETLLLTFQTKILLSNLIPIFRSKGLENHIYNVFRPHIPP